MIRFPLTDWLNQQECYYFLLDILHPQGLCCPYGHLLPKGQCPHRRDRAPILDYRCRECGTVFNVSYLLKINNMIFQTMTGNIQFTFKFKDGFLFW